MVLGFRAMQTKEPEYQGRKLSEWMARVSLNPAIVDPAANEALYAMRHEALPIIEKNLRDLEKADGSIMGSKMLWRILEDMRMGTRFSSYNKAEMNFAALRAMGTNAIPVLKRFVEGRHAWSCVYSLVKIDAFDEVADLLKNGKTESRKVAAMHITELPRDPERSIEPLCSAVKDPDGLVAGTALSSLSRLKIASDKAVTRYEVFLRCDDWWIRQKAADYAPNMGTNAYTLVPFLVELLNDPKPEVQSSALGALRYLHDNYGVSTNVTVVAP